jgi:NAD(P)-dependent dehydrogenase (short-subunit alcohol dehydrogenase family)
MAETRRLDGKVAVVTGGGSGIGAATARRLAREGCRVVIGDLAAESAKAVAEQIAAAGGEAIGVAFDQSDDSSVEALIDTAVTRHGRLDFLHANAADMGALLQDSDAVTVPLAVYDRTMAVNQRGYLLCTRHALPHLVAAKGAIVYTSSAAAFAGEPQRVAYAMSKAAVNALMRHVASRWGKEGVRANSIAPGFVYTEQNRKMLPPEVERAVLRQVRSARIGEADDVAAMVAMLFSADGEWINGQTISVDGGAILR